MLPTSLLLKSGANYRTIDEDFLLIYFFANIECLIVRIKNLFEQSI